MKISEETVAPYRPAGWPGLIGIRGSSVPEASLPGGFFGDVEDIFPAVGSDGGEWKVAVAIAFTQSIPTLNPAVDWYAIEHQCGGLACDQLRFVGVPLQLRPEMEVRLEALTKRYFDAGGGHFHLGNVGSSDVIAYVAALAELGLHCERSYRLLQEGVYPIDATQDHLDLLAYDAPSLDQIADRNGYGGLTIIVLAENSD